MAAICKAMPGQSVSASGEFGEKSCYPDSALVFQLHFTFSTGQNLEDAVPHPSLGQREPENTNYSGFLCAFLVSSTFTGSMRKCMYGPDPGRCWAAQALSGCVQCMDSVSIATLT